VKIGFPIPGKKKVKTSTTPGTDLVTDQNRVRVKHGLCEKRARRGPSMQKNVGVFSLKGAGGRIEVGGLKKKEKKLNLGRGGPPGVHRRKSWFFKGDRVLSPEEQTRGNSPRILPCRQTPRTTVVVKKVGANNKRKAPGHDGLSG